MKLKVTKTSLFTILFLALGIAAIFLYQNFCMPELFNNFNKYDGLSFDYLKEEDKYIDKLYYSQLSDDEAKYYRAMYHAASNGESEYPFNFSFDNNAEFRARNAFDMDFPEYYWICQDVSIETRMVKDKIGLRNHYYNACVATCHDLKQEDLAETNKKISEWADSVIPTLKGKNDLDTIRNVYYFVIDNSMYDASLVDYNDLRSIIFYGRGVCASYSELFQYLCNKLGFECYSVFGKSSFYDNFEKNKTVNTESFAEMEDIKGIEQDVQLHEWNIIKINNSWYWIDVTWADDRYIDINDNLCSFDNNVFFLTPDNLFFVTHEPDPMFSYPKCTDYSLLLSDDDGLFLDSYDENKIENALIRAFAKGDRHFILETNNDADMASLLKWFKNNKFFEIYQRRVSVFYYGSLYYFPCDKHSFYMFWDVANF